MTYVLVFQKIGSVAKWIICLTCGKMCYFFNQFQPNVVYIGHWQKVQNQIRHYRTRRLTMF